MPWKTPFCLITTIFMPKYLSITRILISLKYVPRLCGCVPHSFRECSVNNIFLQSTLLIIN